MAAEHDKGRGGDVRCPACGEWAERGQLVCLNCGGRLALDYRRPYGWKLPLAIVATVLALAVVAAVLALRAVDDDAGREARASVGEVPAERPARSEERASTTEEKKDEPAEETADSSATTWPDGKSGYTVVIGTTEDRASATGFAREARRIDVPAGVLDSGDFRGLGSDVFVVFTGVFSKRADAESAVERHSKRYPGAYPQAVRPR